MFDWFFEFLYNIIKTMLYCIDFITNMAGMLCGITPVTVNGADRDITQVFLTDERVLDAFRYVLVIGFVLLFVFTIFAVIRSIGKVGEGKTAVQICIDAAKAMGLFLLVPVFIIIGSIFVSTVMTSLYHATAVGSSSIGSSIFTVIAEEAYDGNEGNRENVMHDFSTGKMDYYDTSEVDDYFDLKKMNFFIGFVAPIVVLVLIALAMLAFVERLVNIILLFIISPIAVSSSVLDEGARFKAWREQVINKFLVAYASLIAINIFMLMVGVVNTITFFDNTFLNGLARLVFIIGGSIACYKSKIVIGNIIGQGVGSQANQENSAANSIMGGIIGATVGRAAKGAMSLVGSPFKAVGNDLASRVKEKAGRERTAKNAVKAEAARNKYTDKVFRSNSAFDQSTKSGLMLQSDIKQKLYGDRNHQNSKGGSGAILPAASANATPSQGNESQRQNDSAQNHAAAERVMSALHTSNESKGTGREAKK